LEDNGLEGSLGVHWERIQFGNEGMTASDVPGSVFSAFTFKLIEASG